MPFITIASQQVNADKDVFNGWRVDDISYNVITIVRAQDAPDLEPNLRIEPIEDIQTSNNGLGLDEHGQGIAGLDAGRFKLTYLGADQSIEFNNDEGELGNSFTAIVSPNDFPSTRDGVEVGHAPEFFFNIPDLRNELFIGNPVDVVMLELFRGTPGINNNQRVVLHPYGPGN